MTAAPVYVTGTVTEATAFAATDAVVSALKTAALDSEYWTAADDFTNSSNRYLVLKNETDDWFYVVRALSDGRIQWTAGEAYNSTTKVLTGRFMGSALTGNGGTAAGLTLDSSGLIACTLTSGAATTGWPINSGTTFSATSNGHPLAVSPWASTPNGTIKYATSVTQHMIAMNLNDGRARWCTQALETSYYNSTIDPKPIVGIGFAQDNSGDMACIVRAPGYSGVNNHQTNIAGYTGCAANILMGSPFSTAVSMGVAWPSTNFVRQKTLASRLYVAPPGGAAVAAYPSSLRGPRGLMRSVVATAAPSSQASGDTIVINGNQWTWLGNLAIDGGTARAIWVDTGVSATPSAPTSLTATAGDTEVDLSWTAPATTGGRAITDYTIEYRTASGPGEWTAFSDGTSTTTSATVTGLTNGTGYDFRVAAVNTAGAGFYSSTASATPIAAPNAPTDIYAYADTALPRALFVAFDIPTDNGGSAITSYVVQHRTTAGPGEWVTSNIVASFMGDPARPSLLFDGLADGTEYDVRVAAVNAAGTGEWSATASEYTIGVPSTPGSLVASPDNEAVDLSWEESTVTPGSATEYEVRYREATSESWTSGGHPYGLSQRIVGLTNGVLYEFQVRASTSAGDSDWSDTVSATPVAP